MIGGMSLNVPQLGPYVGWRAVSAPGKVVFARRDVSWSLAPSRTPLPNGQKREFTLMITSQARDLVPPDAKGFSEGDLWSARRADV